jgi:type IV pilus assembly protein PilB
LIEAGFIESQLSELEIFQPNVDGCSNCTEGYKGRAGVFQVMPISEDIKTLIMEGCTEQDIEKQAAIEGTLDLRAAGLIKVKEGITSLEEIERVTNV